MKIVLGIDIGGSTTKVAAFDENRRVIALQQVRAADQITCLYGAIGRLLHESGLTLDQLSQLVLTGVGAALTDGDIYGIPTSRVREFEAIGRGGLLLSHLREALIVSMGTGTAFVRASGSESIHIGGSGVGGGTLIGLSKALFEESDIEAILSRAESGSLDNVDLMIRDISNGEIPSLPAHATASNFGKLKSTATDGDLALGLMNMVYQTAGMLAVFACTGAGIQNAVFTGSLASLPQARVFLGDVGALYPRLNFVIPDNATYATALGAASLAFENEAF